MTRTKIRCELCSQEISKSNYSRHLQRHKEHPETFEIPRYRVTHEGLDCKFCGKSCKNNNSLRGHERYCKDNPDRQLTPYEQRGAIEGFNSEGRVAWNKGLTKETDRRVAEFSEKLKSRKGNWNGRHHTEATKKLMSDAHQQLLLERGPELFNHAGKGIKGHYKGIFCASRFELAFLIYCLDSGKDVSRCTKSYTYIDSDGKERLYYPDFIVDGEVVEIKGYSTDVTLTKINSVTDMPAKVLYESDLQHIFDYIKQTYNKDVYVDAQELYDEYGTVAQ